MRRRLFHDSCRRFEDDIAALDDRFDMHAAGAFENRLEVAHRQLVGAANIDAAKQGEMDSRPFRTFDRAPRHTRSLSLASSHNASISARLASPGARPCSPSRLSIWAKRRSNLALAPRSAASGSTLQMAGEIGDDEQQVANFAFHAFRVAGGQGFLDLIRLLTQFGQDCTRVVPVEADLTGLFLQFQRAGQSGQGERRSCKGAGGLFDAILFLPRFCAIALFLGLDLSPQRLDFGRRQIADVAENMRVTADQFRRDRFDDAAEIEMSGLLGHARMKNHL